MSTSSHPGLSFGINRLGRAAAFPPSHPPSKPSPSLPQHASPYQPQAYTPQQAPQGTYPHHLFQTAPSAPQVGSVPGVQNGARPPQSHASPALPGRSQRPSATRQMPPQANPPLSYMQQSMNPQPLSQQPMNPQQMSQQSMSQPHPQHQPALASQQPMNTQQINQQSMNQPHPQHQPALSSQQSMPQQPLSQPPMSQQSIAQQSIAQQPLTQQSMAQQPRSQQQPHSQPPLTQSLSQPVPRNETPVISQQSTPHPPPQQTLPPTQAQIPQISQAQQVQQVQQAQQVPQQPTPPQPAPVEPVQDSHPDDDMEIGSQDGEDGDSLEPKLIDGTPFVPRSPMGELMSAPPEGGSFPTLEAVHKHVLAYCTSVGYAIVIGRSKKTVPGLKKVLFVCDRAGKPPRRVSPEMRKRKTSSRKCDCQFGFFAIEQRTQWTVRYRPDPIHLKHNHGPSESPLLHPAARKLDSKMVAAVKTLKDSGVSQTLEILQAENPHVPLLPRDIYNARAAINRNPQKVATGLAENRAAIYSKPHPSAEERIRADLRREIQKTRDELDKLKEDSKKEIDELKEKIREKDKIIEKFEMFIDICNQRVMVRLSDNNNEPGAAAPASSS